MARAVATAGPSLRALVKHLDGIGVMSTYVAETDQQAREECEEGVWYFLKNCLKGHLRREGRQLTFGPGVPYIPAAAWREYLKGYKPGRKLLGDVENWEELEASQSIIVGSPETVQSQIRSARLLQQLCNSGHWTRGTGSNI